MSTQFPSDQLSEDLLSGIHRAASARSLLVACDFDGTLASIGPDPMNVPVNEWSVAALQELADNSRVVILSGRDLEQLEKVCPLHPPVFKVGCHGAQPEDRKSTLSPGQIETLNKVAEQLEQLVEGVEGAFVEYKPFQRVLHVVRAKKEHHDKLLSATKDVDPYGSHRSFGKNIVEFSVSHETKGTWLAHAARKADAVVFLGDDTTDETGFEAMRDMPCTTVSVKVGEGDTAAAFRVADLDGVAQVLQYLRRLRMHDNATATTQSADFSS